LGNQFIEHPLIKNSAIEARIYQQLVYARAVKANTLFVAPTALGKTILCIMVAAHRLERTGGKVLMLAPTRPLVIQHAKSFRKFTELPEEKIGDVSGTTHPGERSELWPDLTVAVATPQVVENDLRSGRLNLRDYTLLIFDEAHRATGNYAFVSIAKAYKAQCPEPLVLGLTASPGNNEDVIREVCDNLGITQIEVKSEQDPDVRPYINPVEVEWKTVSLPVPIKNIARDLRTYLDERFHDLRQVGLIRSDYPTRKDLLEVGKVLGMGVQRFSEVFSKPEFVYYKCLMDYATALKAEHALELLETQGIVQTIDYLEHMAEEAKEKGTPRSTKSFVKNPRIRAVAASLRRMRDGGIDHPKIGQMVRFVKDEISNNPGSAIIIFTNYRNTVELIVKRLSSIDGVRVVRFVGQASRRSKGLSQREQANILDHFRSGKYNVLVATSVAEEGLDIAEVRMVLFYDCTPSAIRNIQRRGRTGRKGAGRVVIMITENTREEGYHWAGQNRERRMRELLKRIDGDIKNRQLKLDGFVQPD